MDIEKIKLEAQIEILESLFEQGAKNVHQVVNTPVKLYTDLINPLLSGLKTKLKQLT